jgi:hypothetical protein
MADAFRVPGVTYTMPTAIEDLKAAEVFAKADAPELAMKYATALIEIAVMHGPRMSTFAHPGRLNILLNFDPCNGPGEAADAYRVAARALGIL